MADESEEKTEQPTAHKLREARKRGEVGVSHDLTGAVELVAAFFLLWLGGGFMELQMRRVLDEIESGEFARGWVEETRNQKPTLERLRREEASLQIEETGTELRKKMFPST